MRVIERPWVRTAFLLVTFSVLFAGDAWRFTFGWVAFGIIAFTSGAASVVILIVYRGRWRLGGLPVPLLAFLALATLSLAWSAYPGATLLGLTTTWLIAIAATAIAVAFSWREIVAALSALFAIVLTASIAFELVVSLVIRAPILPFHTQPGVDYSLYDTIPKMLYWSRNELFDVWGAGRIQGIVGNANNLGLIALLAVIVCAVQIADRTIRARWGIAGLALAALTLLFTRSATITVALIAACLVTGAVLLLRRAHSRRARIVTGVTLAAAVGVGAVLVVFFSTQLLALLGKSGDLTGRIGIWQNVLELANQRAVAGWGWVSFWMPWAAPFDTLAFRNGVRQLQAHNAWIDVFFQLGAIGLVVFIALVASTLLRSGLRAVDRPQSAAGHVDRYTAVTLLPLLMLTVLLVQSAAESRLLVECGFALLVLFAIKTKVADPAVPLLDPSSQQGRS